MFTLGIILCREGSKGLPRKSLLTLEGQSVITYTFEHVQDSGMLDGAILSTDAAEAATLATEHGIEVVERPPELATDGATVDSAARHGLEVYEARRKVRVDIAVILYANVPVRANGVIDRAVGHLIETGADSVRTVASIGKRHPFWLHRLDGDRMIQYAENNVYRRQDLEPLYYHDGAVIAVRREALFTPPAHAEDYHAFFGRDRRAFIQGSYDTVDIDGPEDLVLAAALLRRPHGIELVRQQT